MMIEKSEHAVSKFRKISACSLDKENVPNKIMKVSHMSYHILNSNFNLMSAK